MYVKGLIELECLGSYIALLSLQDWSDLIEYVIHKFMNTPPKSPLTIPTTSLTEMTKEHNQEHTIW